MQTFITNVPDAAYGLPSLDRKRLVKQLLETRQIMAALAGLSRGWLSHPATKMWYGKEDIFLDYARQNAVELDRRGYKWENNFEQIILYYDLITRDRNTEDEWDHSDYGKVIYTHRGRLWEKDPTYYVDWRTYSDFRKMVCCPRCDYYWPTHRTL